MSFVMDKDCYLWSRDLAGNASPFPLGDCSDDAPVVSPLDGSIAYHNQGNNTQVRGIYVMPPARTTRTRLNLNLSGAQWPSWSPTGQRLAAAGGNPAAPQEALGNLWLFNADGGNLRQITALKGNDALPYGAVWAPDERALVSAGTIWGTNGLWILRLTADGNYCGCAPIRLPTTPGASIQLAGSIAVAPAPTQGEIQPGFFIHREGDEVVVYWGTIFSEFHLEYASSLSPAAAWTRIDGPYDTDGYFFYHTEPLQNLPERRFYRLAKP
jgi:dipeptidyl aminopeptidase/acylaminoacyl peptidase